MKGERLSGKEISWITDCFFNDAFIACSEREDDGVITGERYTGPFSDVNGAYGGVDDLGRTLAGSSEVGETKQDRQVGIFYFLWMGEHGTGGPYDNSAIVEASPDAIGSRPAAVPLERTISGENRCSGII